MLLSLSSTVPARPHCNTRPVHRVQVPVSPSPATSASAALAVLTPPSPAPYRSASTLLPAAHGTEILVTSSVSASFSAWSVLFLSNDALDQLPDHLRAFCLESWFEPRWQLDFTETPARQRCRMHEYNDFYTVYQLTPVSVLRGVRGPSALCSVAGACAFNLCGVGVCVWSGAGA